MGIRVKKENTGENEDAGFGFTWKWCAGKIAPCSSGLRGELFFHRTFTVIDFFRQSDLKVSLAAPFLFPAVMLNVI